MLKLAHMGCDPLPVVWRQSLQKDRLMRRRRGQLRKSHVALLVADRAAERVRRRRIADLVLVSGDVPGGAGIVILCKQDPFVNVLEDDVFGQRLPQKV